MSDYENILTETRGRVGIITLSRPKALSTPNHEAMEEVDTAVTSPDRDSGIGAIIITDPEKVFAAGADIKEMANESDTGIYVSDWFSGWNVFVFVRAPVITAVNGYALGGGCGITMMADFTITGNDIKFGQSKVNLGVTPGMSDPQRLTRVTGKVKATEICLTERMMDAKEVESVGLVTHIVEPEALLDEILKVVSTIASRSLVATTQIKEQINQAYEMILS